MKKIKNNIFEKELLFVQICAICSLIEDMIVIKIKNPKQKQVLLNYLNKFKNETYKCYYEIENEKR